MDPEFWNDRWQRGDIGFHQPGVHDLLQRHWHSLSLDKTSPVFVPLCGKAHDMVWLAAQGHEIIGSELSDVAIDAFFDDVGLEPVATREEQLTKKQAGPYALWQGDFFALTADKIATATAVYDRAALVAFPEDMQARYAAKLIEIVPHAAAVFLISLSFDSQEMSGPPFSTPAATVDKLFAPHFDIEDRVCQDALAANPNLEKRGLSRLHESVFILRRS